uniref:Uncharacterized protein n=1 Tax=Sphaerodactylus townsendi TaxID=933632 RepID=A0ACB8FID5_9SAUR
MRSFILLLLMADSRRCNAPLLSIPNGEHEKPREPSAGTAQHLQPADRPSPPCHQRQQQPPPSPIPAARAAAAHARKPHSRVQRVRSTWKEISAAEGEAALSESGEVTPADCACAGTVALHASLAAR